jgi:hypothetical protein
MPSLADLIFVALLGVLLLTPLSVRLLGDAGIGWHIRTGQQILRTAAIPRVDPFSVSTSGRPWYAWEWLYDVVVGELDARLGLNGVVWLTAIVIGAAFAMLFHWLMRRGVNVAVSVVMVLLAVSASMVHFLARPHVVSWLLALIWYGILDACERDGGPRKRHSLWALPALMLVWVNVHGGFLLGFVLLGIFWADAVWTWFRSSERRIEEAFHKIAAGKRSWDLVWVGLLSGGASLINPYGWRLHTHIYSYLSNRFLIDHIEEFQSPNFHAIAQKCFGILVLVAIATLAARARGPSTHGLRPRDVLIILFAVYEGLYASRNIPISSILLVLVVAPQIPLKMPGGGFLERIERTDSGMRGHVWPIVASILALGIVVNGGRVGATKLVDAHFDPKRMPTEAVNFLESQRVRGPILSPDYWGGYLIYRLYPKEKVVVDDRHDLYGEPFFKSYLKAVRLQRGWQDFLREHEAGCLVLPRDGALANGLVEGHGWKSVYADDVAIVFVAVGSVS